MKMSEYITEDVVDLFSADLDPAHNETGVDIPVGYDSFYVKPLPNAKSDLAHIYGVKADGPDVKLSSAPLPLANALAKFYNSGGKNDAGMRPVPLTSDEYEIVQQVLGNNFSFARKPSYLESIRKSNTINSMQLRKIQKELHANNYKLPEYHVSELYDEPSRIEDRLLMSFMKPKPPETMFIMEFQNGDRYLINTSGGGYARNWMRII